MSQGFAGSGQSVVLGPGISAAGSSVANGTVVFSNSNNVSFGMNGSTVTASASSPAETPFGLSAGTQSVSTGTLVLSNSNGVSFGMSGSSRVTASFDGMRSVSAGTQDSNVTRLVFANGSGVTFGLDAGTITASVAAALTAVNVSAGTTSNNLTALTFANGSGVSFGLNASTITASVAAGATATGNFGAFAAGTQTATSGTVVLSDSNGLTFGMSGSTRITGSHDGLRSLQDSATTLNASRLVFSNGGNVSFGFATAAGVVTVTASSPSGGGGAAISAAGASASNGTVVWSNSNNVSFGMNGSTITATASYTSPVVSNAIQNVASATGSGTNTSRFAADDHVHAGVAALGNSNTGNTAGNSGSRFGTWVFAGTDNITVSASSGGAGVHTLWFSAPSPGAGAGASIAVNAGATSVGSVVFSNSNGVTFGGNASTITASHDGLRSVSAGTQDSNVTRLVVSDSNGISFGLNAGTLTASPFRVSMWENGPIMRSWAGTSNSISIQQITILNPISATRCDFALNISGSSSGAGSFRINFGLYTQGASTLNSVFTTSRGLSFNSTSAISYTAISGVRSWSIPLNGGWNITPGHYFAAFNYGLTTASTNTVSWNFWGPPGTTVNGSGWETGAFANNTNYFRAQAINNNAQSTLPATMQLSGMTHTGVSRMHQPWFNLIGTF